MATTEGDFHDSGQAVSEVAAAVALAERHGNPTQEMPEPEIEFGWQTKMMVHDLGRRALRGFNESSDASPEDVERLQLFSDRVEGEIDEGKRIKFAEQLQQAVTGDVGSSIKNLAKEAGVTLQDTEIAGRLLEQISRNQTPTVAETLRGAVRSRLMRSFEKNLIEESQHREGWLPAAHASREHFKALLKGFASDEQDRFVADIFEEYTASNPDRARQFNTFSAGVVNEMVVGTVLQELQASAHIQQAREATPDEDMREGTDFIVMTNSGANIRLDAKARGGMRKAVSDRPLPYLSRRQNREGQPVLLVNLEGDDAKGSVLAANPHNRGLLSFKIDQNGAVFQKFAAQLKTELR